VWIAQDFIIWRTLSQILNDCIATKNKALLIAYLHFLIEINPMNWTLMLQYSTFREYLIQSKKIETLFFFLTTTFTPGKGPVPTDRNTWNHFAKEIKIDNAINVKTTVDLWSWIDNWITLNCHNYLKTHKLSACIITTHQPCKH
jgi:hypothetical protein